MKVGNGTPAGHELLLAHCAALDALVEDRPHCFERLADEVGERLAWLLVFALTGDHGARSRDDLAAA